jgi:hypothetical protein
MRGYSPGPRVGGDPGVGRGGDGEAMGWGGLAYGALFRMRSNVASTRSLVGNSSR